MSDGILVLLGGVEAVMGTRPFLNSQKTVSQITGGLRFDLNGSLHRGQYPGRSRDVRV